MALRHTVLPPGISPKTSKILQQNIDSNLHTDDNYRRMCNEVVKSIGNILKNNVKSKYRPAEVIKAGSAGKGTAIKGKSDLDLVFLLPDSYGTVEKLEQDRQGMLNDIENTLNTFGYNVVGRSSKALQVRVQRREPGTGLCHTIDIDLLPAINLNAYSTSEVYDQMSETVPELRKFFTPSLTKLQTQFIKQVPEKVKRLIEHVKDWKDEMKNSPPSYAMELLIVHLWQKYGKPENFDFTKALGCVMKELANCQNLRVEFYENYNKSRTETHSPPYIIDPVNPHSNVMKGYDHWPEVSNKANKYIRDNLKDLTSTGFI